MQSLGERLWREPLDVAQELAQVSLLEAALDPVESDVWRELRTLHGKTSFMGGSTPSTTAYIEASGSPRVLSDLVDRAGPRSTIAVVALHFKFAHKSLPNAQRADSSHVAIRWGLVRAQREQDERRSPLNAMRQRTEHVN